MRNSQGQAIACYLGCKGGSQALVILVPLRYPTFLDSKEEIGWKAPQ
jgi:hypothetical protein